MLPGESSMNWRVNRQLCTHSCKAGAGERSLSEGRLSVGLSRRASSCALS